MMMLRRYHKRKSVEQTSAVEKPKAPRKRTVKKEGGVVVEGKRTGDK